MHFAHEELQPKGRPRHQEHSRHHQHAGNGRHAGRQSLHHCLHGRVRGESAERGWETSGYAAGRQGHSCFGRAALRLHGPPGPRQHYTAFMLFFITWPHLHLSDPGEEAQGPQRVERCGCPGHARQRERQACGGHNGAVQPAPPGAPEGNTLQDGAG